MCKKFGKLFFLLFLVVYFLNSFSNKVFAEAPFVSSYATLSNSRFSFVAGLATTVPANASNATIYSSGSYPDTNTGNLFPKDTICFNNPAADGCSQQATYTVTSVVDNTSIGFSSQTPVTLQAADRIIASQTGRITVTIVPTTYVASGGYIRTTIAGSGSSSTNCDGMPDYNGFDCGDLTTANINSNITPSGFTVSASSLTSTSGNHVILMTLSSALNIGSTYSYTIGNASTTSQRFINPAPYGTGYNHTRGVAETQNITVQTENSSNTILDKTILKVAPVDGVLVSANVELSINYTIGGLAVGSTACTNASDVTTTATAVPFGSIINYASFYKAAQSHTVSTNASNGYVLTVQEDSPLTEDGNIGVGVTIRNTGCDSGSCTSSSPSGWATATNYGFGYSMQNVSGSDAAFTYATGYKPFSTSATTIMSNSGTVSSSQTYTCYKLTVPSTQTAGYYLNKLTYIATPRF